MNGTIELTTDRLVLRKESLSDAENIYKYLGCDPEITKYTGWNPYTTLESTIEKISSDIKQYDEQGHYSWVITLNGDFIGTIGAYDFDSIQSSIEIGYSIISKYWGNGYASEATQKVVDYLMNVEKIKKIIAWTHRNNIASLKVLKKAGFIETGTEEEHIFLAKVL